MSASNENLSDGTDSAINEKLVGQFLEKLDQHGPSHAEVKRFLQEHPELHEWEKIVSEMATDGRKQHKRSVYAGLIFSGALVITVFFVIVGVYRILQLSKVEAELSSTRTEFALAGEKIANLEATVKKQDDQIALLAHAKVSIAKIASERDDLKKSLAQSEVDRKEVENKLAILNQEKLGTAKKMARLRQQLGEIIAALELGEQSVPSAIPELWPYRHGANPELPANFLVTDPKDRVLSDRQYYINLWLVGAVYGMIIVIVIAIIFFSISAWWDRKQGTRPNDKIPYELLGMGFLLLTITILGTAKLLQAEGLASLLGTVAGYIFGRKATELAAASPSVSGSTAPTGNAPAAPVGNAPAAPAGNAPAVPPENPGQTSIGIKLS